MKTYQRSSTDAESRGAATVVAVSRADDRVGVDERTTTPSSSVVRDSHDEGQVALGSSHTADNVGGVLIPLESWAILGDSSTRDEDWRHNGDEERLDVHVGRA